MLAIFVGILAEQMALERRFEVLERRDLEGYPVTLGSFRQKPIVVCRTGLGERRGEAAAEAVFSAYNPTAVVSARMASSVPHSVRIGDLVLCEKVYLCHGYEPPVEPPAEADQRLLALGQQAAREAGLRYTLSSAFTAATLSTEPLDWERVPRGYSVAVVDTEGHSLAQAAAARKIPFLAVRVALGGACDRVPDSLNLLADRGVIRPWRAIAHHLRRPGKAPAFLQLALSGLRASRRLSTFTEGFLREWSLEP